MTEFLLYHNGIDIPTAPPIDHQAEEIGYGFEWAEYLEAGEVIIESSWRVDGPLSILWQSSNTGTVTSVGLTPTGTGTALVTNKLVTSLGKDERSFYVKVDQL